MIHIMKVVKELRQKHKMEIQVGSLDSNPIKQLLFWTPDRTTGQESTLYLAEYTDDFPPAFSRPVLFVNAPKTTPANRHIYVSAPIGVALTDIYNIIQEMLYQQLAVNLKKEELFEVLQAGTGIRALTQVAYTYLQNPIKICDTSFTILHRIPEEAETDDIVEQNGRLYIRDASIDSMRSEKLVDKLFHARLPFFSNQADYEYNWLYCNVRINDAVVGYICVQGTNRPFTEQDVDFVAIFANMLSVEMQKSEFFMQKTGLRYEYFLNDLLSGRFNDEEAARKRLTHLGRSLDRYFWVLTFFHEKNQKLHITSGYFIEQIHAIFPKGMTILYNNTPVVLLSNSKEELFHAYQQQKLEDFLQFNHMNCAVSYCFTNILETPHFYRHTLICGELHAFSGSRIVYYESIAVQHILQIIQANTPLFSMIHPKIRKLLKYDSDHNTDFNTTLRCYLENGRNASKTAAALGIHKSTLSYRIGKIAEISDLAPEDTDRRFILELSFWMLDYLASLQ